MRPNFRRLLPIAVIVVVAVALVAAVAWRGASSPAHATSPASQGQSICIGHHPQEYIWYTGSCSGHDEPEIDPLSSRPGSAKDLTWTIVLPTDNTTAVDDVGPTFWIGGTVTDPNSR